MPCAAVLGGQRGGRAAILHACTPAHRCRCSPLFRTRVQVRRMAFGKGGIPHIGTHDGRTIRYPDPEIKVG